jgi:imidazolonepropionase-like amidohydrolase
VTPRIAESEESTELSGKGTVLAGRVLQPDGTLQAAAVVEVRGQKIKRVGKSGQMEASVVSRWGPHAVVCPGLLDLFASPSASGQTVEDAKTIDPDASPANVLDPNHRHFRTALEAGITSVTVGPSAVNLVSGVCLTVRTHPSSGRLEILRDDGPLILGFGEGVWRTDRAPTSRAGAVYELRNLFESARAGSAHPRINAAVSGQLSAWIACSTHQDLRAMRELLGDVSQRFGVIHTQDAVDAVQVIQQMRQPVVMGPYSMDTSRRTLIGAAALAKAGIEVAFRGGFPKATPDALRLSAALAVRHGMDPAAARRAITIAPAKVAGVADRIGSIVPGKDADLVVFSHDPLRMDARVLEVYVKGQRVYASQHQSVLGQEQ